MSDAPQSPVAQAPTQSEVQALIALLGAGKLEEAITFGEGLAGHHPGSILLCQVLGAAHVELKRHGEAASWFARALEIDPGSADVLFNLGVAKQELGLTDEATACYERVVRLRPDHAEAHHNLGTQLHDLGRKIEAIACFRRAIAIKSDYAEAHYNLGLALQGVGRRDDAVASYRTALRINPDHAEAYCNLGVSMQAMGRLEEALACYERVLTLKPDHLAVYILLLHLRAHMCDWAALDAAAADIPHLGVEGEAVSPFAMLSFEDCPARHRTRAEKFGAICDRNAAPVDIPRPPTRPDRLRIGYFSADFCQHATMNLMIRLFEVHDRERFSIHVFSYGPQRDDDMRQRLKGAVERFHDVTGFSDAEIAELARREGIDIAVDLKGYTQDMRLGIFAWRPAPVQMTYLGFPGTLGVPFIDYLIGDRVVIPDDQRRHIAEKIVYLPDSYQVNDNRRVIADTPATRAEAGLPHEGFIFCCFNNSYKISAAEFDIWMRLLDRVEGSVLWLLRANARAEANLRREARQRCIDPDRLIFAARLPQAEHLARQRLADLFLDTFNVNAHTTASDALWAGLPVLTMVGRSFVARVAASLLHAVGLPELVVGTPADYEGLALALATDPARLGDIRARLAANRLTAPLFDTERITRKIEAAYDRVYADWFAGRDGDDIVVE